LGSMMRRKKVRGRERHGVEFEDCYEE
jgi:hypothetical protein